MTMRGYRYTPEAKAKMRARHTPEAKAKMRAAARRPEMVATLIETCRRGGERGGRKTAEVNRAKKVPITLAGRST